MRNLSLAESLQRGANRKIRQPLRLGRGLSDIPHLQVDRLLRPGSIDEPPSMLSARASNCLFANLQRQTNESKERLQTKTQETEEMQTLLTEKTSQLDTMVGQLDQYKARMTALRDAFVNGKKLDQPLDELALQIEHSQHEREQTSKPRRRRFRLKKHRSANSCTRLHSSSRLKTSWQSPKNLRSNTNLKLLTPKTRMDKDLSTIKTRFKLVVHSLKR